MRSGLYFNGNCPNIVPKSISINNNYSYTTGWDVQVVPNPNTGIFSLFSNDKDLESSEMVILNFSGTLISKEKVVFTSGRMEKSLNVAPGVYLIELTNPLTKQKVTKRIVVL